MELLGLGIVVILTGNPGTPDQDFAGCLAVPGQLIEVIVDDLHL